MRLDQKFGHENISYAHHERFIQFLNSCEPERVSAQFADLLPPYDRYEREQGQLTTGISLAQAAIIFQRWCGLPVSHYSRVRANGSSNNELVALEYRIIPLALAAWSLAARVLQGFSRESDPQSLSALLEDFVKHYFDDREKQIRYILGAEKLGIPWHPLTTAGQLLEFGHGKYQKRIWKNFSSATSHIASVVSSNKQITAEIFRNNGLPVPSQVMISDEREIAPALRHFSFPLVVKPAATDFGTAVHLNLKDETAVRKAFTNARQHGKVLIEEQIAGDQHRLMVINGKFRSARRHKPAHVKGDGKTSIIGLVNKANVERLRNGWKPIPLDDESEFVLDQQGLQPGSIPDRGVEIRLRSQANLSTGGTMEVMTDVIHSDNIVMAERAAAIVDIDIAGIDYITTDITRPWHETNGAICEINVTPGLIFNEEEQILSELFPEQNRGNIPIVAILDPDTEGRLTKAVVSFVQQQISPVCVADCRGLWRGNENLAVGSFSTAAGVRAAVGEPSAAAVVVEVYSKEFCRSGLGVDGCDILVVNPVHADSGDPETDRRLAEFMLTRASKITLSPEKGMQKAEETPLGTSDFSGISGLATGLIVHLRASMGLNF
ncbi:MAG: hypothetical protein R3F50_06150 [Gammaproteobacteria bacterium]